MATRKGGGRKRAAAPKAKTGKFGKAGASPKASPKLPAPRSDLGIADLAANTWRTRGVDSRPRRTT